MKTRSGLHEIARKSDLLRPYITQFFIRCNTPNKCHNRARRDGFIVPQSCKRCGYNFKRISLKLGNSVIHEEDHERYK